MDRDYIERLLGCDPSKQAAFVCDEAAFERR